MIVSQMPEDMVPDVEAELEEEKEEQNSLTGGDLTNTNLFDENSAEPSADEQKQIDDLVAGGMNEQDAKDQVMQGA
jgi:hypothetical protein